MPVDWAAVSESIRLGTTGRAAEGLRLLIAHEATCESDRDRAAICNGKARSPDSVNHRREIRYAEASPCLDSLPPCSLLLTVQDISCRLSIRHGTGCASPNTIASSVIAN